MRFDLDPFGLGGSPALAGQGGGPGVADSGGGRLQARGLGGRRLSSSRVRAGRPGAATVWPDRARLQVDHVQGGQGGGPGTPWRRW
jgi:hypothetical protein